MKYDSPKVSIPSFGQMLRQALGDQLDPAAEGFIDMMAPDGVMEFPFSPAGGETRVEGRAALAAYLKRLSKELAIDEMVDLTVHRGGDAGVFVLEFGCIGRGLKTNEPYRQRYVSVITVRDGHIVRYVDYWNPLTLLRAVGGEAALASLKDDA